MFKVLLMSVVLLLTACTPRVEVSTPDKPIEINLNVKIDHEVLVKMDKDVDQLIANNDELF